MLMVSTAFKSSILLRVMFIFLKNFGLQRYEFIANELQDFKNRIGRNPALNSESEIVIYRVLYLCKKFNKMNLETKIMDQIKEAMKSKNTIALEALRAMKSEILLLKTSGGSGEVSETQETALLQKLIKQRKEAAEQFTANHRTELAEKELAQAEVIQEFLPQQLSIEELEIKIKEIIVQTGAESAKDMGKVMGTASSTLAGKADGKTIAETVKRLLGELN